MNVELEKKRIVEELQHREEEWLIIAIKKLLDLSIPENFTSYHKNIIEERIESYKTNPNDIITLEQLKKQLQEENKL